MILGHALLVSSLIFTAPVSQKIELPNYQPFEIGSISYWRANQQGNDWYIRSGSNMVKMPDEKTAKKTAKKFNKIEKKEKKKESGVYDDGSRECSDPMSGVLC